MSTKYPIFKNASPMVVGSLKEETKIFKIDEADILTSADENIKKFLSFDKKQQRIKIKKQYDDYNRLDLPDWLKIFLSGDELVDSEEDPSWRNYGYLNEDLYFKTFMEEFYEVIKKLFWSQKCLVKKFLVENDSAPKMFWVQRNFG